MANTLQLTRTPLAFADFVPAAGCRFALVVWLLLMGPWPQAHARWQFLGILDGQTYSMDVRTLSTTPLGNRRFWALIDYNRETRWGVRSLVMELEIDCLKDRIRRIQAVGYRGDVQQGGVVWRNRTQGNWETIARDSLNRSAKQRVCMMKIDNAAIYTDNFPKK